MLVSFKQTLSFPDMSLTGTLGISLNCKQVAGLVSQAPSATTHTCSRSQDELTIAVNVSKSEAPIIVIQAGTCQLNPCDKPSVASAVNIKVS